MVWLDFSYVLSRELISVKLTAYEKFWVSTLLAKPSLGTALTGWRPKRLPLTDGMDIYWVSQSLTCIHSDSFASSTRTLQARKEGSRSSGFEQKRNFPIFLLFKGCWYADTTTCS